MSSSRSRSATARSRREADLVALGFDPEALSVRDPGLLFAPRFLGALHAELVDELGPEESGPTLVQIGFLQGLRDALRVVSEGRGDADATALSPLPILLRRAGGAARGAVELCGSWPAGGEAAARRAQLGAAPGPSCFVSMGYTSGWLSGVLDADVLALETSCDACGSQGCRFVVREAEVWRASGCAAATALLDALPFAALRDVVSREATAETPATAGPGPEEAVIHIWGPVMVVPYSGPEEVLAALQLLGNDPGAAEVSIIVLDLTGVILDEAFGASGLEQILDQLEGWGGEVVLAGISPLSQAAISGLARPPALVQKDLHHAIAAAFQMADAQRRSV